MIQVYTGNGKGKTTAALGLAVRAAGAGMKVYIAQFVKGRHYSELNAIRRIRNIKLEQFGRSCFIRRKPTCRDLTLAAKGLEKVKKVLASRKYKLVILDEINIALKLQLIDRDGLIRMIKKAPRSIEVVLTGRCASREVKNIAHLVSEVKEVKHYYRDGIKARRGIEF